MIIRRQANAAMRDMIGALVKSHPKISKKDARSFVISLGESAFAVDRMLGQKGLTLKEYEAFRQELACLHLAFSIGFVEGLLGIPKGEPGKIAVAMVHRMERQASKAHKSKARRG